MLDTRQTHSLSDFIRDAEAHVARLKETRAPEVLTVNGRAEAVLLDTETYEDLLERVRHIEAVAYVRDVARESQYAVTHEDVTEAEIERSHAIVDEIMAETDRLGLYH